MYTVAKLAVENALYNYDKLYTYLVPEGLARQVRPGCRVKVPFGGGNRSRTGIVLEIEEAESREKLKPVDLLLDAEPLLNEEGLILLRHLKERTFCTWFDGFRLLCPAGLGVVYHTVYSLGDGEPTGGLTQRQAEILAYLRENRAPVEEGKLRERFELGPRDPALTELLETGLVIKSEIMRQRIQDDKVCMVRVVEDAPSSRLTPKQAQVMSFLEEAGTASLKEICYYTGVTRAVVDNLQKREQVEYFDLTRYRSPFDSQVDEIQEAPELSPQQKLAFERLLELTKKPRPSPALLHGVTGSGKTQVFLQLVDEVIHGGRTALILVPEISLTAQAVDGFRSRFGDTVAVLHSALSLGERMDEWRRIRDGEASVVVGTRSAVFAPLQKLGLIVIDEEQEHTYSSDKSPRFHARDIALRRSAYHGALLLLASATPSVESYYHAKQGRYSLLSLDERFNKAPLPDTYIVDMREAANLSPVPAFSQILVEELQGNLERGEQSILLLNRRGYSTVITCSSCGAVADCPNCSVAMTYHTANDSLLCHYCGYIRPRTEACEHCGSSMIRYGGAGTQKLEQELAALLPEARILRVDTDTTMQKFSHERLFTAFRQGEYDIMIGTQMVAKGLNFPNVTLVGALSADQALYAGDFRSYERAFSLLTQVVGRSGRGSRRGRAFIQTYSPDHPVIQLAAAQDYPTFYGEEIGSRKIHLYPPFCTMAGIGFTGEQLSEVQSWSERFLARFRDVAAKQYGTLPFRALGPSPCDILKAAGKYRYKLILKCKNNSATRALLAGMLEWFHKECKTVSVFIDLNYDRM